MWCTQAHLLMCAHCLLQSMWTCELHSHPHRLSDTVVVTVDQEESRRKQKNMDDGSLFKPLHFLYISVV